MTEYYPIFAIPLLWLAAWTDLTRRLIRNWISIALLLLFVLFAFFTTQPLDVAGHMLWAAGLFAVMFIGFCFGKVGGGDVKLATVTMLWAGPEMGPVFLVVTALTGGGVDIASGLSAGFSILSQAVPSTDDAVSGFLSMASFAAPGIDAPISTLTRQIEAVNRTALGAFVRRTSISMATELLPKHTFISYDQAAKVSESFIDLIGQEMDRAGGDVAGEADSGVFAALSAVRSAVIDFTRESGAGKAKVIEDLPWQTEPSQITAYRLYGDASRADEIVARNGLAHPNLVPSWGPVEVLDE